MSSVPYSELWWDRRLACLLGMTGEMPVPLMLLEMGNHIFGKKHFFICAM